VQCDRSVHCLEARSVAYEKAAQGHRGAQRSAIERSRTEDGHQRDLTIVGATRERPWQRVDGARLDHVVDAAAVGELADDYGMRLLP
jgi:hypothetical protein